MVLDTSRDAQRDYALDKFGMVQNIGVQLANTWTVFGVYKLKESNGMRKKIGNDYISTTIYNKLK